MHDRRAFSWRDIVWAFIAMLFGVLVAAYVAGYLL